MRDAISSRSILVVVDNERTTPPSETTWLT